MLPHCLALLSPFILLCYFSSGQINDDDDDDNNNNNDDDDDDDVSPLRKPEFHLTSPIQRIPANSEYSHKPYNTENQTFRRTFLLLKI